ncbi:Cytochrome c oxidase subunit 4 [Aquimixticola soesokkakensis]|uniref:Cytochrome c oxidase subunit 4 n=1 Tax=Aquimixticola soesokkakensis TaxID=1519096 RepID=A0A1Y5RNH7_9RHOB|nr:aa3-type cytochrome c oxidase subunit IV [Aquimixticola soesokkakensis]SLN21236.1 Cytochrome c oxidase subunit 4 [Aquimixticola soesokkakensis]
MAEYKIGSMDISEHEKTYKGFIKVATYVAVASIGVLVFLAIFNS